MPGTRGSHLAPTCSTQTLTDEIEFTEGMEIDRGFVSPYFVKDQESQLCELENPRVLITDRKINNMQELVPLLEGLVASKEPLLIIAEDVTGEALSSLVSLAPLNTLPFRKT
eukprot:scaffold121420_cov28-Tisochrysis_lutea.AAC.3